MPMLTKYNGLEVTSEHFPDETPVATVIGGFVVRFDGEPTACLLVVFDRAKALKMLESDKPGVADLGVLAANCQEWVCCETTGKPLFAAAIEAEPEPRETPEHWATRLEKAAASFTD
jgi:hypothetical protein